jgi:putative pyruvate formate lyase activating enzyme
MGFWSSEEPFIVPTHELFLAECNMRCKFCQAWEGIVRTKLGFKLTGSKFVSTVGLKAKQGALNIHFVGGEPTVNLLAVLVSLKSLDLPLPIVWNTNLFATDEAMKLLDGVVDLFVWLKPVAWAI